MVDDFKYNQKAVILLQRYRAQVLEKMKSLKSDNSPLMISKPLGKCIMTTPQFDRSVKSPMFQASFPGSGSEMLRDLTEHITGVKTTDAAMLLRSKLIFLTETLMLDQVFLIEI
jgi:hypothetical protein